MNIMRLQRIVEQSEESVPSFRPWLNLLTRPSFHTRMQNLSLSNHGHGPTNPPAVTTVKIYFQCFWSGAPHTRALIQAELIECMILGTQFYDEKQLENRENMVKSFKLREIIHDHSEIHYYHPARQYANIQQLTFKLGI